MSLVGDDFFWGYNEGITEDLMSLFEYSCLYDIQKEKEKVPEKIDYHVPEKQIDSMVENLFPKKKDLVCKIKKPMIIDKEKKYKCTLCDFTVNDDCQLLTHYRIIHEHRCFTFNPVPEPCVLCSFDKSPIDFRHYKRHHIKETKKFCTVTNRTQVEQKYFCSICDKYFIRAKSFREHLRTHNKIKPYKCLICNKEATQISNMKTHLKVHEK